MPVKTTQSSYRDRMLEFQNVAERLKKSFSNAPSSSGDGGSKAEPPRSAVSIQSEFNKRASKIGFGIHQTSQKLAKLAKCVLMSITYQALDLAALKDLLMGGRPLDMELWWVVEVDPRLGEENKACDINGHIERVAKRTSVFDDPTVEIQELTAVIKQDITALNSAVVALQLVCNSQNESGNISSDTTTHSTTVVDNLKNRLMSTTKEFKDVLTMRTENMKVHDNRRQLFSSTATKESTNPFVRQRPLAGKSAASASPPPWANDSASSSQLFPRKLADGESQPLLQQQQNQQQQQLVPLQDTYMQSRAEALHNVESTIHELSSIFTQLATMVSQQGELAIRIDENMEDTLANVEGAQGQLVRNIEKEKPGVNRVELAFLCGTG
ncbi:hypothetical protein RJ639_039377 [Escallonia herrerae]|uniref:t-SNARE coiled-coil homology domain-containing protein n=1 Tax=Escallonia herrerae TaxID=1293975 RepID=A0AA88WHQ2_9ASTE|nr:hypothetical protein RJ639_039377 [Escallonia herrerae]